MSTVHCPLCGLGFTHRSQFEVHAREDHVSRPLERRSEGLRVRHREGDRKRAFVVQMPW